MRAWIDNQVLFIHADDVPAYKKQGSIVRNNYFWALRSIADRAGFDRPWEFADAVWIALSRMLTSFDQAGYLYHSELMLEFPADADIPATLKPVSTWRAADTEAE